MEPKWLEWVKALQSIAQTGMHYTENPFDVQRYEQITSIAADIAATYSDEEMKRINDLFMQEPGPSTPKINVRGVVFKADAILMVKERLDGGRWTLPGGWADVNEPAAQATVREVREESGYETRALKLLALYDRTRHGHPPYYFHTYKVFFRCEITGGAPTNSLETDGVGFFREDEIPEADQLSIARVTPAQIQRLFEHYHNPDLPADFD